MVSLANADVLYVGFSMRDIQGALNPFYRAAGITTKTIKIAGRTEAK